MEMTPIDPRDNYVSSGDGATPHGRELSSTNQEEKPTLSVYPDPKEYVKREVPVDQAAQTLAAVLRRADPKMDAETAHWLAKLLLDKNPAQAASKPAASEEPAIGTTLDVSA